MHRYFVSNREKKAMVSYKRSRQELHSRSSSIYSATSSSNSSLLRSPTVDIRFKQQNMNRKTNQKRRRKEEGISETMEAELQHNNQLPSTYQFPASSDTNIQRRLSNYSGRSTNLQHSPNNTESSHSRSSSSNQSAEFQALTSYQYSKPALRYRSQRSKNSHYQPPQSTLLQGQTSGAEHHLLTSHLQPNQTTRVTRMPSTSVRPIRQQSSRYRKPLPRRPPIHTAASLEALNKVEFGSPTLLLRRKKSTKITSNSRMRRFFVQLFRRRTRPKYYYTKAQLSKSLSLGLTDMDGNVRQYKVRPAQLLALRPLPRTPSLMRKKSIAPTAKKNIKKKVTGNMISEPIDVTKHAGLMETGNSEVLSIRSRRSSSMIRVRVPDDSPLRYSQASSSSSSRFRSAQSSGRDSYDTVDERLDRIQRELDETRRMRRHLSNASGYTRWSSSSSGSTSSTSFFYRHNSLLGSRSFISLTSQVLSTHEDHPEVIKRSDLFTRKSLRHVLGHMTHPPSSNRISRMDKEMGSMGKNSENSVEFVNSWSEYLQRAIAVRAALRTELRRSKTVDETRWRQQVLNSLEEDEEETASSYIGETETVSSFNTSSSDRSRQATQNSRTDMRLAGRNVSGFTGSSSRGGGSNSQQSTPTQQSQDTGRQHSMLIPRAEEPSPGQKEFYVDDNGEVISITPVSMTTPQRGKILTVSAVRLALMQGTLADGRYSGLTGQIDSDMFEPTTHAWKQTRDLSSPSSESLEAGLANPKRQRSKSISSISTGSTTSIPVPERSQRRVVSEQYSKERTMGFQAALSTIGGSTTLDEDTTALHTPTAVSDGSSEYSMMTSLQKTKQNNNPRPITLSSEGSSTVGSGGTRDSIYYVLDSQRRGLYDDHHPSPQQQQQQKPLTLPMLTTHGGKANIPRMPSGSKANREQQEAAAAAIIAPTVLIPQRSQQRNSVSSNSSGTSVVSLSRGKRNKPNKPRRRLSAESNVSCSSSSTSSGMNYLNGVGTLEIDDSRRLNTTWIAL